MNNMAARRPLLRAKQMTDVSEPASQVGWGGEFRVNHPVLGEGYSYGGHLKVKTR